MAFSMGRPSTIDVEQDYVLKRIKSMMETHNSDKFDDEFKRIAFAKITEVVNEYFAIKGRFGIIENS